MKLFKCDLCKEVFPEKESIEFYEGFKSIDLQDCCRGCAANMNNMLLTVNKARDKAVKEFKSSFESILKDFKAAKAKEIKNLEKQLLQVKAGWIQSLAQKIKEEDES